MRVGLVALSLTACRFGFDARAPDAPPPPDATAADATAADFVGALACETDVPIATVPVIDELQWLDLGGTQIVFAIHHLDVMHHEVHAHVLGVNAGQIVKIDDITAYAAPDLTGMVIAVTPTATGIVIHDASNDTVHAIRLDAELHPVADTMLPGLLTAYRPYARTASAALIVGTTASGIGGYLVDDTLAPTTGLQTFSSPADSPAEVSIAPLASGFLVAWAAYAQSTCKYVRIAADGVVIGTPLAITITGGNCRMPSALAVGGSVVTGFHEATSPTAYAAVLDATVTTATTPVAIGAADSQVQHLVDDTTRALAIVRTNGDSRVVAVALDGTTQALGADFGLSGNDTDHETAAVVAGALLHVRSEGGMLRLRKLCR